MDTLTEFHDSHDEASRDVFIYLIFGLHQYLLAGRLQVPTNLRHALNTLSFTAPIPKTLHSLVQLAHQPVSEWYPLTIPDDFNPSSPLLYDGRLSEEAEEYQLDMSERLDLSSWHSDLPQSALDNDLMQYLRKRLKSMPDQEEAQALYEAVRLFLIRHSWTTLDKKRAQGAKLHQEIKQFYIEIPDLPLDMLRVCDRCGLLLWRNGRWEGIKPSYCSDHGDDSPYIHEVPNQRQLYRLKEGIHLRTFIPGRLELALFEFAEEMQKQHAKALHPIERYPGIDTYDLGLVFSDEDIWAVDAKDHAYPGRLARQIRLPYGEGSLAYQRFYFVLPNKRVQEEGYIDDLQRELGRLDVKLPDNLKIVSLSSFQTLVQEKLKSLTKKRK